MITLSKLVDIVRDTQLFVSTMLNFVSATSCRSVKIAEPFSCLQHDDEELCLFWTTHPKVRLEVGLSGNGQYSFWGKDLETGRQYIGDHIPVTTVLPVQLVRRLIQE